MFTAPKHRLATTMLAVLALTSAVPALADSEIESLKRELAQQRQLIEKLLAQQEAQKQTVSHIEEKVAAVPAPTAAATATATTPQAWTLPQGMSIYGVLDGGVERISNVKNASGSGTVTRMPGVTGTVASRLGFKVRKELVPGIHGIATLETGFNLDSATLGQSGRIFGRQLFAGVDTAYGTFTLGRQYSMLVYAMDSDLLGPNIYALGSLDAYLPNARYDNSLAWRGKWGKLSLGTIYSLARDSAGGAPGSGTCAGELPGAGSNACRGWSAMIKYDDTRFGVAAAIDEQKGGTGATLNFFNGAAPLAFTQPQDSDRRTHLGAYAKVGDSVKVGTGWLGRKGQAAATSIHTDTYYLEGAWHITPQWAVDGGYHHITNKEQERNAHLYVVRGSYNVTPDFALYAQIAHISNSAKAQYTVSVGAGISPPAGGSQTATMLGLRYRF